MDNTSNPNGQNADKSNPFETATYFDILGVPEDCEDDELIKQQYRKLAFQHHPDRQSDPEQKEVETMVMAKINQAYDTLKDPEKRKHYRQQLHNPEAVGLGESFGNFEGVRIVRLRPKIQPTEVEISSRLKDWGKHLKLKPMTFKLSLKHVKYPYPPKLLDLHVLHLSIPIRFVFATAVILQKPKVKSHSHFSSSSSNNANNNNNNTALCLQNEELTKQIDREISLDTTVVINIPLDGLNGSELFIRNAIIPALSVPPSAASSNVVKKLPKALAALGVTLNETIVGHQETDMYGNLPPLQAEVVPDLTNPDGTNINQQVEDIHLSDDILQPIVQMITVQLWTLASQLRKRAFEQAIKMAEEEIKGTDWIPIQAEVEEDETKRDVGEMSVLSLRVPVIIQIFKYHHKDYAFILNAATGETCGVRPYSFGKRLLAGVGGALLGLSLLVL